MVNYGGGLLIKITKKKYNSGFMFTSAIKVSLPDVVSKRALLSSLQYTVPHYSAIPPSRPDFQVTE